jgi:hypothetical protein
MRKELEMNMKVIMTILRKHHYEDWLAYLNHQQDWEIFISHKVSYPIENFISYENITREYKTYLISIGSQKEPNNFKKPIGQPIWCRAVILNNFFNFIILKNIIEFNKIFLRFDCRILRNFKGMKKKWSKSI